MASGEQRGSHFFHSFTIHDDDDDDYFGALFFSWVSFSC